MWLGGLCRVGGEWCIYQVFNWWLLQESIVTVCEFNYLYLEVWAGCEGWFIVGGAPKMHNISGLSRASIYILVDSMCMGVAMTI